MHVHGDVLDSLHIGRPMRSLISANPERKATFGVVCEAPKPFPLPMLHCAAQGGFCTTVAWTAAVYRWQGDQQHGRFYGRVCSGSFMYLYIFRTLFHVFLKSKTRLCGYKSTLELCPGLLKDSTLVPAAMGLCNVQREAVSSPDHTDNELMFSQHSRSTSNSYSHIYQKDKNRLDHGGCCCWKAVTSTFSDYL